MTDTLSQMSAEEKRALLRQRLAAGRKLPKSYPASYSQRRLWFMHKLAPDSPAYNVEAALPLGAIDDAVLERAINGVVARHEALRTTFVEVDGEPVQRVAPELHVPLERRDLSRLPNARRSAELSRQRKEAAIEPFDLAHGPLVRTKLLRIGLRDQILLLNLHHILADGWSMGIFSRELTALYQAFAAGQPSPLPPLTLQYGDYAAWQRREGDDGMGPDLAWWTDTLADMPTLELPTDHPRPPVQSYVGAFYNCTMSAGLTERLERFARDQGVTLFMALLTGFKVVLARLAQTDDVAVGTYIANRERTDIEGLIGFFLNTLVLRSAITSDAAFQDMLQGVKETALGAYAHQQVPFERLVEVLRPPRDLGRNPLVQVVFQLQNATEDRGEGAALIDYQRSAAAFDLATTAYVQGGKLHFTHEYATDLFTEDTIARLAQRLEQVLEQAIAAPSTAIADLDILLDDERPGLDAQHYPSGAGVLDTPVTQLFASAAEEAPDALAFYVGETAATIGQVAMCADRIAAALADAGVSKGDAVGVCVPRSVEGSAALMAIWQVGGVYVPLDPAYPPARIQFMAADSRMVLALTRHDVPADALPGDLPQLNINDVIGDLSQPGEAFEPVGLAPDDPSHIIYTSGSTGQPKGAVSSHRQVLNRLHWMWRQFPHSPDDVEVVKTATSFIDSIWELCGPLIAQRPASIVDADTLLEPARLVAQLARDGVSRMWVTPSYLRLIVDHAPDLGAVCPSLQMVFVTGDKLPTDLVDRCADAIPNARLFNLYGTSEAWDICCDTAGAAPGGQDPVPVGHPLDGVTIAVLDGEGKPLPHGVPGELYIGGHAPCLGFAGWDDLSASRFVTVATPQGAAHMLSSGDQARRRSDGIVEILGRIDDEVKINGMRVHPAEVEAALSMVDGINTAAVAGVPDAGGALQLWAWVIGEARAVDLRAALMRKLPVHMVPARFLTVDSMPQTPSGKIDRRALVAAADLTPEMLVADAAPATDAERQIADIFAQVLGHAVGLHQNFFAAGGHSLLAARALARINDKMTLDLGIQDFFLHPTVAGLVARAGEAAKSGAPKAIKRLKRSARVRGQGA